MNDNEFYGDAYGVMKQTEGRLLKLIHLYETEKEKEHDLKPIIYICSRIKSPDSVLDKLRRKGLLCTSWHFHQLDESIAGWINV